MRSWKKWCCLLALVAIVVSVFAVKFANRDIAHSEDEILELLRKEKNIPAERELIVLGRLNDRLFVEEVTNCRFYALQLTQQRSGWKIERIPSFMQKDGIGVSSPEKDDYYVLMQDNPELTTVSIRCGEAERKIDVERHPSIYYLDYTAEPFDEILFFNKDGKVIGP